VDVQTIKNQHNLATLAHQYGVQLQRSGRGFVGLCPFHDDHNPSFSVFVTPNGWFFKCYGGSCGRSGDVIDFVGLMRFGEGWDPRDAEMFKEALRLLGERDGGVSEKRYAVAVAEEAFGYHEPTSSVRFLWDIALSLYAERLTKNEDALRYLIEGRQLPHALLRRYRFGYCPPEGSNLQVLVRMFGKKMGDLAYAGLFRPSKRPGSAYYEFFYDRITFADVDYHRNPRTIFGRSLPGSQSRSKYLGLAGFPKPVFGLDTLSASGPVFLMEGPINAMICLHWGHAAIALTGTCPSQAHIQAIREKVVRRKRKLVPVIDNDQAGTVALSRWRALLPEMLAPLLLPAQVDGHRVKDLNDLLIATKKAEKVFEQLVKKHKAV